MTHRQKIIFNTVVGIYAALMLFFIVGCGGDDGSGGHSYVHEGNLLCRDRQGVISYAYGQDYDVVVCGDRTAHEIVP